MGKKPVEKSREWEKGRRDKLNVRFAELSKLLPDHDPAVTLSKLEILTRAAIYIKKLQEQNDLIMQEGRKEDALKHESDRLKKRVAHLLLKTKILVDALRAAGVPIPSENKKRNAQGKVKGSLRKCLAGSEGNQKAGEGSKITPSKTKEDTLKKPLKERNVSTSESSVQLKQTTPSLTVSSSTVQLPLQSAQTFTSVVPQGIINPIVSANISAVPVIDRALISNLGPGTLILPDGRILNVQSSPLPQIVVGPQPAVIVMQSPVKKGKPIFPKRSANTKTTFSNKTPIPAVKHYRFDSQAKPSKAKPKRGNLKMSKTTVQSKSKNFESTSTTVNASSHSRLSNCSIVFAESINTTVNIVTEGGQNNNLSVVDHNVENCSIKAAESELPKNDVTSNSSNKPGNLSNNDFSNNVQITNVETTSCSSQNVSHLDHFQTESSTSNNRSGSSVCESSTVVPESGITERPNTIKQAPVSADISESPRDQTRDSMVETDKPSTPGRYSIDALFREQNGNQTEELAAEHHPSELSQSEKQLQTHKAGTTRTVTEPMVEKEVEKQLKENTSHIFPKPPTEASLPTSIHSINTDLNQQSDLHEALRNCVESSTLSTSLQANDPCPSVVVCSNQSNISSIGAQTGNFERTDNQHFSQCNVSHSMGLTIPSHFTPNYSRNDSNKGRCADEANIRPDQPVSQNFHHPTNSGKLSSLPHQFSGQVQSVNSSQQTTLTACGLEFSTPQPVERSKHGDKVLQRQQQVCFPYREPNNSTDHHLGERISSTENQYSSNQNKNVPDRPDASGSQFINVNNSVPRKEDKHDKIEVNGNTFNQGRKDKSGKDVREQPMLGYNQIPTSVQNKAPTLLPLPTPVMTASAVPPAKNQLSVFPDPCGLNTPTPFSDKASMDKASELASACVNDILRNRDLERNSFIPIIDDVRLAADFSSDLFSSFQVTSGSGHPESISPTAAFLLAFPLVSTSKTNEAMSENDHSEHQTSTPTTILQIGNIDPPNSEMFQSVEAPPVRNKPSDLNKDFSFDVNNQFSAPTSGTSKRKDGVFPSDNVLPPKQTRVDTQPMVHENRKTRIKNTNNYPTYSQSYSYPIITGSSEYTSSSSQYTMCDPKTDSFNTLPWSSTSNPTQQEYVYPNITQKDNSSQTQKPVCDRKKVDKAVQKNANSNCNFNQRFNNPDTSTCAKTDKKRNKSGSHSRLPVTWMATPESARNPMIEPLPHLDMYAHKETDPHPMASSCQNPYSSIDLPQDSFPDFSNPKKSTSSGYSWSPSKSLLSSLDTHNFMIPATLPTLVGDLALGTNTPSEAGTSYKPCELPKKCDPPPSKKNEKATEAPHVNSVNSEHKRRPDFKNQANNTFLSVSQLVDPKTKRQAKADPKQFTKRQSSDKSKITNPPNYMVNSMPNNNKKDNEPNCMYTQKGNTLPSFSHQWNDKTKQGYKGAHFSAESLIAVQQNQQEIPDMFPANFNSYQNQTPYYQNTDYNVQTTSEVPSSQQYQNCFNFNSQTTFSSFFTEDFQTEGCSQTTAHNNSNRHQNSKGGKRSKGTEDTNYQTPNEQPMGFQTQIYPSYSKNQVPYSNPYMTSHINNTTSLTNFNLSTIFPEMNDQRNSSTQNNVNPTFGLGPQQNYNNHQRL